MTASSPPDAIEVERALDGHWTWLADRDLVQDLHMGTDSKDGSEKIVRVDRRLLADGFYEMINSATYRALSAREQGLVPVVAEGVRRLQWFLSAIAGRERYERAFEQKLASAEPEDRARLESERPLSMAVSDDSHARDLAGSIAEYSRRSRTVRAKLRKHRALLPSKHQVFKEAGFAQFHPYLRERWLLWWLERHLDEVEQELAWYEQHLRGPRGAFPTGHEGPITNAEWRRIRDEQRASLRKHGAKVKEIAALFEPEDARVEDTGAAEHVDSAGLDAKDEYAVGQERRADREKKRVSRATENPSRRKKS